MAYMKGDNMPWTAMTSNTAPAPMVASASSEYSAALAAWHAFDGAAGTSQYWLANAPSGYLQLDIGPDMNRRLWSYAVKVNTIPENTRAPRNWIFQGSMNGISWDTLDTQIDQQAWSSGEQREFNLSAADRETLYRYFRINISLNNGDASYVQVAELYLYECFNVTVTGAWSPPMMLVSGCCTVSGAAWTNLNQAYDRSIVNVATCTLPPFPDKGITLTTSGDTGLQVSEFKFGQCAANTDRNVRAITISGSNNQVDWTQLVASGYIPRTGWPIISLDVPVQYKYYKVDVLQIWGSATGGQIGEMYVRGPAISWAHRINDLGMTHTNLNTMNGDDNFLSDDDLATYWQSTIKPNWWQVDLGAEVQVAIERFRYFQLAGAYTARCWKSVRVSGSLDGAAFDFVGSGLISNVNGWQTFSIANSTAYRFYRAWIADNWGDALLLGATFHLHSAQTSALVKVHNESVSIEEGSVRRDTSVRILDETVQIVEAALYRMRGVYVLAEVVNILEATVQRFITRQSANETVNITEGLVQRYYMTRIANEIVSIIEALVRRARSVYVTADTVQIDEGKIPVRGLNIVISETIQILEAIVKVTAGFTAPPTVMTILTSIRNHLFKSGKDMTIHTGTRTTTLKSTETKTLE